MPDAVAQPRRGPLFRPHALGIVCGVGRVEIVRPQHAALDELAEFKSAQVHRDIDHLAEIPFVVADKLEEFKKTKEAVTFLRRSRVWADIEKVYNSKRYRAGKGKGRNRRYKKKLGPVIVYNKDNGVVHAFRNIPGVDLVNIDRLNLLKLAPGGHVGRLIIWTESAFRKLDAIYGTLHKKSTHKADFHLPAAKMTIADFARLIRSEEIVKAVRPTRKNVKTVKAHFNPLKKSHLLVKLNPYSAVVKRAAILKQRRLQKMNNDAEKVIQENITKRKEGAKTAKKAATKK